MVNLANKQFRVFFVPDTDSHERLRIFRFDEKTGHFQAAMDPENRNVYGVLSSSGRIEFHVTTHGDNVFTHFVGALKVEDSSPQWMAGTFVKFTPQTTGLESGKRFVFPFYAVESS